jgi:hypothetical protein
MDYEKLIKELNDLRKNRAWVRFYMGLLVIVSSLLPVTYIILQVRDFVIGERGQVFVSSTIHRVPSLVENQQKNVTNSIERVAGKFIGEFQRVADRDFPVLEPALYGELEEVVEYAGRRWNFVSNNIDVMAMNHQRAILEKLNDVLRVKMTDEQVDDLVAQYKRKMLNRVESRWNSIYQKSEPSMRRIERNLISVVEKEPDFEGSVPAHQALGVLLEYVGVELQSRETFQK